MNVEKTTYKYLGTTLNNKGSMDDHIKNRKTEAALQTIFNITCNKDFNQLEMKTIWKLVETYIIPTVLYAAETWTITNKRNRTATQNIGQHNKKDTPNTTNHPKRNHTTRNWNMGYKIHDT